MKRIIKDYFTFSKKERVAITVLLLVIACFIAMPYLYPGKHKPPLVNKVLADYIAKNKKVTEESGGKKSSFYSPGKNEAKESVVTRKESFPFDPNTITQEEWQRLGVAEKTVRTIINYRNKGGKFRTAEDIRKIWGMRSGDADRLVPFVRLEIKEPAKRETGYRQQKEVPVAQPARKEIVSIEINTATEDEWKSLPGIGEVLAKRILKFREYAGGFTTIEQVRKTYGLADSVFQRIVPYLKINMQSVPKLDLNLVSAYDLRRKLNVDEGVAKAIVVYRKQNGPYQSIDGLKKIILMSDTLFQRIAPLVKIE
jgi:competence protein ComEA